MQLLESTLTQDFFTLFGLKQRFNLDLEQLQQQYRELQASVHPDRFVDSGPAQQRLAMQSSARVNEAYQTLRQPVDRARYLLSLNNIDTEEESNTAMPPDFLMMQMEWREAVEDAVQAESFDMLELQESRLHKEQQVLHRQLEVELDIEQNYRLAATLVRKLRFLDKLEQEIDQAYAALDDAL